MSTQRFRRLSIASAFAIALALYGVWMGWSLHRQHQTQVREYTLLLQKIEAAHEKQRQLQTSIAQRRVEILLRQKGRNTPPGDFWMPGELDRLRMKRNARREG
ncbi:MAG TPA: hypothetical protein VGF13_12320 [Verrucomicrobiae bacterium]